MENTLTIFNKMLKEEFLLEPNGDSKVVYQDFYPKNSNGCYIQTFLMFGLTDGMYIKMLETVNKFGNDEGVHLYITENNIPEFDSAMINVSSTSSNAIIEKMEELEIDFCLLAEDVFKANDRPIPKGAFSILDLNNMYIVKSKLPATTKYVKVGVDRYEFTMETVKNRTEMSEILNIDERYLAPFNRVVVDVK